MKYIYVHIYIYTHHERCNEHIIETYHEGYLYVYMYVCIRIYIYIQIHIYIYIPDTGAPPTPQARHVSPGPVHHQRADAPTGRGGDVSKGNSAGHGW